jgi:hypothetical protein
MPTPPADAELDLDLDPESAGDAPARTGIQSIEVGFRLLDVLARTSGPMMLRDLARAAPMNPAKAHRYLVSFARWWRRRPRAAMTSAPLLPKWGW